jgi:hypothetical protein
MKPLRIARQIRSGATRLAMHRSSDAQRGQTMTPQSWTATEGQRQEATCVLVTSDRSCST